MANGLKFANQMTRNLCAQNSSLTELFVRKMCTGDEMLDKRHHHFIYNIYIRISWHSYRLAQLNGDTI